MKGSHLSVIQQSQNMKGNDSTVHSKTKHKDKSCSLKNIKRQTPRPEWVVWNVFVICAHWRGSKHVGNI